MSELAQPPVDDGEELSVIIKKLKKSLSDVLKIDPQYNDDWFLFPFLKNHSFDVEKAAANVRESVRWRKEVKFERLAEKDYGEEIYQELPFYTDGLTREGIPVGSFVAGGDVDHKAVFEKFGRDRYLRHFYQFYAKGEKLALEHARKTPPEEMTKTSKIGLIFLVDVGNYGLAQAKSLGVIQAWIESVQNYRKCCPGVAQISYMLNMNKLFAPIFKMIRPFLEGPCLEIQMFDEADMSWKDEIFERILPSQVRPSFGGTRTDE